MRQGRELVEDIYPLTSVQQGMLFHSLYSPGSGIYVTQFSYTLSGPLVLSSWQHAWQQTLARHPVLRTSFQWEGLAQPLQIVWREVELSWHVEDWSGLSPSEQEEPLEAFLACDRKRGTARARCADERRRWNRLHRGRLRLA